MSYPRRYFYPWKLRVDQGHLREHWNQLTNDSDPINNNIEKWIQHLTLLFLTQLNLISLLQMSAHVDTSNELLEAEKKKNEFLIRAEMRCKESNCLRKTFKSSEVAVISV